MSKLTVLLTGPGGRIGPHILPTFSEAFHLRVLDKNPIEGFPDTILTDLQDKDALKAAMQGVDVVVHLAATSDEAPFIEQLVPNNVVGLYNVFEAARESGVRRIVFASTVQTISFYDKSTTVEVTDPPRPVSLYACTKILGETMGRWFHDKHKMEFVAVRIGWFQPYDSPHLRRKNSGARRVWLSPRDCAGILRAAAEKDGIGYLVVHASSRTEQEFMSLKTLRENLGYEPVDDIRAYEPTEE